MSLADLLVELEAAKDPKKAGPMEAYMRQQFSFLGIAAPERNALYRKYFPSEKKTKIIDWDFVDTCWEKKPREYQYVGANYLKAMQSYLTESDLPKLERLVVTKSWWDTIDILDRVVGNLVYDKLELGENNPPMEPIRQYLAETSRYRSPVIKKRKNECPTDGKNPTKQSGPDRIFYQ